MASGEGTLFYLYCQLGFNHNNLIFFELPKTTSTALTVKQVAI